MPKENTAASFQFDLSCQEATGHETDDTFADEDGIPSLVEAECESDDDGVVEDKPSADPKVPTTLVSVAAIGRIKQSKALVGLRDSGGSHCCVNA